MIDLGLAKLALIGVVALVVIGPEKLPKVARMAGSLYGRAQRYINQVKSEVSREIELDELRKMQQEVQSAAQDIGQSIAQDLAQTQRELQSAWHGDEVAVPEPSRLAQKAKNFRRKKLARSSAIPAWYKQQHGTKMRVTSGAARVAKHRPGRKSAHSFF
ncbi:Sec-independent protein translocase protein TatB [Undibacterium arcticum]|uniref:Sec-independent protein translocase protein TatB n=1 Tax=Undibacterium arcticum TaxID=1762892 RepID=A0ABV7F952_9BURK